MDVEREINNLKQRVSDLEGAVNVVLGDFKLVQPELVGLKNSATSRFDVLDGTLARLVTRLDTMNAQVWSLRDDLPMLMAEALRQPPP